MKKLLALSMAAMMALGMASTINAAESTDKTVDTSKTEDTQNGEVYGEISNTALKQLKVTLPIKIDFIISPKSGEETVNKMTVGEYAIAVDKDSETGVKLESVKLTQAKNSEWTLLGKSEAEQSTDLHAVSLNIAGVEMVDGKDVVPTTDFTVLANKSELLDIKGTGSKADITAAEPSSLAFDVVYTISQYTAPTVE